LREKVGKKKHRNRGEKRSKGKFGRNKEVSNGEEYRSFVKSCLNL
jgi:hypothetical protein